MRPFELVYRPFPAEAGGVCSGVLRELRGRVVIMIDSSQDADTQAKALRHELAHLALGHLDDGRPLKALEEEAEKYADQMSDEGFNDLMMWRR